MPRAGETLPAAAGKGTDTEAARKKVPAGAGYASDRRDVEPMIVRV